VAFCCGSILWLTACGSVPFRAFRGARYYAKGSEALETGDPDRAIEELERAAELVPQASEIQNHLGLAYWAAGQPKRARHAFDRAVELDCDNRAARVNRGRLEAAMSFPEAGAVATGTERSDEGEMHGR